MSLCRSNGCIDLIFEAVLPTLGQSARKRLLSRSNYKISPDDHKNSKKPVALIPSQLTVSGSGANRGKASGNELPGLWPFQRLCDRSSHETILTRGPTLCSDWAKNGVMG
jgi:hypothetical protein